MGCIVETIRRHLAASFLSLTACAAVWVLAACGSTQIDTGDNSKSPLRPTPVTPTGNGECWAAAKTLPAPVKDFCDRTPASLKKEFFSSLDAICRQGNLVNLLREDCGWNGAGPSSEHIRVLKSTPVTDQDTTDFEYLSAYSLNAGPAKFSYPGTLMLVALDPKAFRSTFEIPGAATITPDGHGITRNENTTTFHYNFEVNGLAKFGFLGEVNILRVDANLVAVFNQAVANLEGLKSRRNLTLVSKLSDGREKLLTIEERLVPDMGQHQIALVKMLKLDRMEMENRYANSLVREAPPELDLLT